MGSKKIGNSDLRSFGLIVGAGFAVIGLVPVVFRGQQPRLWAVFLALALAVMALLLPAFLKPFHRVWMIIGEALGWVNTRLILGLVYYLMIVPIGAIRRLSGSDPMQRNFDRDAATYKISRLKRPSSHMQRQY